MIVTRAFTNETVNLDRMEFVDCEFRSCVLVYRGGPVPVFNGSCLDDCEWKFESEALNTVQLLRNLYKNGGVNLIQSMLNSD